jgi:hypothetical protein
MALGSFDSRSCYGFFSRPSIFYSVMECPCLDSNKIRPILCAHGSPVVRDNKIVAFISLLLSLCRPPAIFLRVPIVIIYSVYRMIFTWFIPHVIKEIFKFMPFFADSNSSASVIRKHWVFRVSASRKHITPSSIFWSAFIGPVILHPHDLLAPRVNVECSIFFIAPQTHWHL